MGMKIQVCKNIKHINIHTTKNIYINKAAFIFIVILSSLIIYAKLGSIWWYRPSLLSWVKATDTHSIWGWPLSVLISVAIQYLIRVSHET